MVDRDSSIQDAENVLRDLIQILMSSRHGDSWVEHLGATSERVAQWKERRDTERRRRSGAVIDEHIFWYSDFSDLWTIIKKNWDLFKPCFGDLKRVEVYLDRLGALRNPGAHSRALLPFERSLVEGMTGELRQQVTLFISSGAGGPESEHFPRIEVVRDSFGHHAMGKQGEFVFVHPDITLRPGDEVVFSGSAWDPDGRSLTWAIKLHAARHHLATIRGEAFEYTWQVSESDIAQQGFVSFLVSSDRSYHRLDGHDDEVNLVYRILPRR